MPRRSKATTDRRHRRDVACGIVFRDAGHRPAFFVPAVEALGNVRALSRNSVIAAPVAATRAYASARDVHTGALAQRTAAVAVRRFVVRIARSPCHRGKVLKTSAFMRAHRYACIRTAADGSGPGVAFAVDGDDHGARTAPSRRRRVLTVKKTVIRFRHNNTWPQKRVSATQSPARDTTRSSTRMVVMVDAGVVSPAKLEGHPGMQPAARSAAGFFVSSSTGSGTTRPARRRLTVGPIPAVRFVLGSSTCKFH